jgi:hypothetical protein
VFQFLRTLVGSNRSTIPGVAGAIAQFQRFEKDLQRDFFELAAQSGKPRGLRWLSCDWLQELLIVVEQDSHLMSAFSSVNLGFEAIEGGDMEEVEAVSTIRDGSAVFHFQNDSWGSAGRVVFNMNPTLAAEHLIPEAAIAFHRKHRV